jgi:hypothetical protein
MTLKASIQQIVEARKEQDWERAKIPQSDIALSRLCGMHPKDIGVFLNFSRGGYLVIVRCPKRTARVWHGMLPPKNIATKEKTGSSGVVVIPGKMMLVSDYDLMCIWKSGETKRKVFVSAAKGAPRGAWLGEALSLVRELNRELESRIQHGCQDDFQSTKNPGVKLEEDHFLTFHKGVATYLPNVAKCEEFYVAHGLPWLYGKDGKYMGPVA